MSVLEGYRGEENIHVPDPIYSEPEVNNEERKALNTDTCTFQRNILREEFEYTNSNSSQSIDKLSTNRRNGHQFHHKTLLHLGIAIGVVAVILSLSLSVFSVIKYQEAAKELRAAKENRGKVCLPCDTATIQQKVWKESSIIPGECCVSLEELLLSIRQISEQRASAVVGEALEKQTAKLSTGSVSGVSVKTSAHIAIRAREYQGNTTLSYITADPSGICHMSQGLALSREGRLRVTTSGYYYVYAKFKSSFYKREMKVDFNYIRLQIMLTGPDVPQPQTMLRSDNMKWQTAYDSSYSFQTDSVAGVIYIPANSEIYAPFQEKKILQNCSVNTCYFGLFRI